MKEMLYNLLIAQDGAATLTIQAMLINYAAACMLGGVIFVAYKTTHSGPVYSARFNISLVMLTLITTIIMSVIGNNIALSLGMVGALSIVRFRTAIKDPRDTAYIFWTIAVGICCGVSDYLVAAVGSVFVFAFLILFGFTKNYNRVLLVIHGDGAADEEIDKQLQLYFDGKASVQVHNLTMGEDGQSEYIYEVTDKLLHEAANKYGPLNTYLEKTKGIRSVNQLRQENEMTQ